MSFINFYPGPSRVESKVPRYVNQAYKEGIIAVNHRSQEFMDLVESTRQLLIEKLNIPESYTIYFISSATECWEILGQSFIENHSYHLVNGSFAEKWVKVYKDLGIETDIYEGNVEDEINVEKLKVSEDHEMICVTQNETSNGTQINGHNLHKIQATYPDHLIAVDATSSLGGIYLEIELADIWYASVQKCLGLPAGMAIMICSPRAVERGIQIGEIQHYNSFVRIHQNMEKNQTHYTPNILDIYLLNRVLQDRESIDFVGKNTLKRYERWVDFIDTFETIEPLVSNAKTRSRTVICLKTTPEIVVELKKKAKNAGVLLGNGYGAWKDNTVRIANFPALKNHEITYLRTFLEAELV